MDTVGPAFYGKDVACFRGQNEMDRRHGFLGGQALSACLSSKSKKTVSERLQSVLEFGKILRVGEIPGTEQVDPFHPGVAAEGPDFHFFGSRAAVFGMDVKIRDDLHETLFTDPVLSGNGAAKRDRQDRLNSKSLRGPLFLAKMRSPAEILIQSRTGDDDRYQELLAGVNAHIPRVKNPSSLSYHFPAYPSFP